MTEQAARPAPDDPMPEAPEPPDPNACCHSGCAYCVEDLYAEERARYLAALAAWHLRHPAK
ncbi:oxidoreductase-like domain-containing protein [Rugamonas apoptosis]|uniref:Oxidoreductase-like protein n=1 Tax=Rugamonas apoptosis TaxID=2758570 RepID=A0A7W2FAA9_9BURK|nr:oxidoreductase-like domain-containing protein [Rugamonas apoptosis]MBA5688001.1 oxidoreductase-like protein [Rugamonas apoptosis]